MLQQLELHASSSHTRALAVWHEFVFAMSASNLRCCDFAIMLIHVQTSVPFRVRYARLMFAHWDRKMDLSWKQAKAERLELCRV